MNRKKRIITLLAVGLVLCFGTYAVSETIKDDRAVTVGGGIATYKIHDEDDMHSDSNEGLATQQSIRAFVSQVASLSNMVTNQKVLVWSGGTNHQASNGVLPDGWTNYDTTNTGATLYRFSDSAVIATGGTEYGNSGGVVYVQSFGTQVEGDADEHEYFSSVSTQQWHIDKFRGQTVQVGALFYADPGTTGSTSFARPYIVTCTNARAPGVTGFATYPSGATYVTGAGWQTLSAVTTVPNDATAFAWGIEYTQRNALTGESVFWTRPFCVSGVSVANAPAPSQNEVVMFDRQVDPFGSGGSTFGIGTGGSLDLSADASWGGIVPDNATEIYATVIVSAAYANALHLYGDDALGGVSFFGVASGTSPQATTAWIPVDAGGDINISNPTADFSGTSLFVHGARIR